MFRVTVKGIWAHKRRLVGTVLAVVLGVAFLTGTLVLGDTMRAGFDDLFTDVNAGTDAVVRSETEIGSEETTQHGVVDASLAHDIRGVEGVAAVEPYVEALGQLVDKDGDPIGGDGPPTLAGSWITEERLSPWRLVEGRAPAGQNEVVLARGTAEDANISVGATTTVLTPAPVEVHVVGLATIGDQESLGGATYVAFSLADAQRYFVAEADTVSEILVAAEAGVSQETLATEIQSILPDGIETLTGVQVTDEENSDINDDFLGFFEAFLLVFAGVALLVASFSIYNTFSIITVQRTRESALLRAIGGSRAQILGSMSIEALVIGSIACALGLAAGIGLAAGSMALMDAAGFGLPDAALAVKPSTVVWGFAVGMLVTLLASILPATRASRVAPLAALRDVAVDRSGSSRVRAVLGILLTAAGAGLVLRAALSGDDNALPPASLGALLTIVGVVVLGPVFARPTAAALGAPLPLLRRVTGRLARENATRNPRRTASTASALMVGVAVVTLFTVFAASVKAAIDDEVDKSFAGDFVIATQNFSSAGLDPHLAAEIDALPEVENATGWGLGSARVDGDDIDLTVIDPPKFAAIFDVGVVEGSIADLTNSEIAVSEQEAADNGWSVGDRVELLFATDGATEQFTIGAFYQITTSADDYIMSKDAWTPHATQPFDIVVMISLADGVTMDSGRDAVQQVADAYFAPDVQDRDEYMETVAGEIDTFLTVIYAMLALAIVIALMGIANTLSLSVYERTRELGLLRAVGQTRSQLRAMVRWESVIIAMFGTIGGVGLGLFLGWGMVEVVSNAEGIAAPYTVPPSQVVAVLLVGAIVGLLAGVRPAYRAAKLNVLEAIATN